MTKRDFGAVRAPPYQNFSNVYFDVDIYPACPQREDAAVTRASPFYFQQFNQTETSMVRNLSCLVSLTHNQTTFRQPPLTVDSEKRIAVRKN